MEQVRIILKNKPIAFVLITIGYLLFVSFAKWGLSFPLRLVWFFIGGVLGIYFLDSAEVIFNVKSSPFRSIVFATAFAIVSFFVISSSGNTLAIGLVLSIFLTIIIWMIGEWGIAGNLNRWYQIIQASVPERTQKWIFVITVIVFLFETFTFIRIG